jgi:hypothetical protein
VNPLAALCRRLGLDLASTARLARVSRMAARLALGDTATGVTAYFTICEALGASLRLRPAAPLVIWLDRDWLDARYMDPLFRRNGRIQLPPVDATRKMLRRHVKRLRVKDGYTYQDIVDYFQASHVCTAEGLRNWRRSSIGQIMKQHRGHRVVDDDVPVIPNAECLADWRDFLCGKILTSLCVEDPVAPLRYQLAWRMDGSRMLLEPRAKMPEKPREWIIRSMSGIVWLPEDCWGVVCDEPLPAPPDASRDPASS